MSLQHPRALPIHFADRRSPYYRLQEVDRCPLILALVAAVDRLPIACQRMLATAVGDSRLIVVISSIVLGSPWWHKQVNIIFTAARYYAQYDTEGSQLGMSPAR